MSTSRVWLALCLPALALAQKVDFLKEVQPILTARCIACHSSGKPQAGLRIHTRNDLLRGGQGGPAIVAGHSADSLLIQKVTGQRGLRMPPSGPPLTPQEVTLLRHWIDQGAIWDGALETGPPLAALAPRRPPVPAGTAVNPIDRFIDSYLAANKLPPARPVADSLFARRAWLDITGLPPTRQELAAFQQNTAANKRNLLVDQLLARRRPYAEHWISFWNDLLRNDEGVIYHGERKSITAWLLTALENNTPYDELVRTLLNPAPNSGAEGFLTGMTWRGVVSASQNPPMQAAQNSAQVFLGVNLKCAACHDSFVNRWKLRDTYGLAAMFSEEPLELVRCDVKTGQMAEARFPFPDLTVAFDSSMESRRHAAASWFTHPGNGRFARTIVNRYWKALLGRGFVEPADDMDVPPWNRDLLDWLASDFAEHHYDLQHLLRQIITSRAYQMPAAPDSAEKTYLFRGPTLRRLTAEQFEDTISAITGDWRINSPRNETYASYTREWRLKSDPLSRALGRPIRDQVYTERATEATTFQALELTNGPHLSQRLERASRAMLGQLPPAPENLYDSKLMRSGKSEVDINITGATELHLLIQDVDSYDPARVIAFWANAELIGPDGATPVTPAPVLHIAGKGYTRFRAQATIDDKSRASDISPAVRFFVFQEKPDPDRLIRIAKPSAGQQTLQSDDAARKSPTTLAQSLYLQLLQREATPKETAVAARILSAGTSTTQPAGLEDLLWSLLLTPEFQFIH